MRMLDLGLTRLKAHYHRGSCAQKAARCAISTTIAWFGIPGSITHILSGVIMAAGQQKYFSVFCGNLSKRIGYAEMIIYIFWYSNNLPSHKASTKRGLNERTNVHTFYCIFWELFTSLFKLSTCMSRYALLNGICRMKSPETLNPVTTNSNVQQL